MGKERVLCVDDDPNILDGFQRQLRKEFDLETAVGPEAGLAAVAKNGPFSVIVTDMQMPKMNGIQFLATVKDLAPNSIRMMLTGNADQKTAIEAVNEGSIFRFLNKPCPAESLAKAIRAGIRQYELVMAEKELLEKTVNGSVRVLMEILSMADPESFGRAQAVRVRMRTLAGAAGIENGWTLELGAMFSQIGNITIPSGVLSRVRARQELSPAEKEMVTRIPEVGSKLLSKIPRLEPVAQLVLYACKRFDGKGFPADDLAGVKIPLGARMLKVVTDLVELEAAGMAASEALEAMRLRTGWYDPNLLDQAQAGIAPEGKDHAKTSGRVIGLHLKDVSMGQMLIADVLTLDGKLLISKGHLITDTLLDRLRNHAKVSGVKEPILVQSMTFGG